MVERFRIFQSSYKCHISYAHTGYCRASKKLWSMTMYNFKSPSEKIQALFFQALLPLDKKLRPADIDVTIVPLANPKPYEIERNSSIIKIDLSKTSFARFVPSMKSGLPSICGLPTISSGIMEFHADPARIANEVSVKGLQEDLASSLLWNSEADHLVAALSAASKGMSGKGAA